MLQQRSERAGGSGPPPCDISALNTEVKHESHRFRGHEEISGLDIADVAAMAL
jgi:hypothetical protein